MADTPGRPRRQTAPGGREPSREGPEGTGAGLHGASSLEKRPGDILERYRAIFERSLVCLYVHDLEGNFLDANQAALRLLGYRRQDIVTMNLASALSPDQLQRAFDTLQEILRTGKQEKLSRYELRRKDGSVAWVETEGSLLYRDGKPYAVQGIARDITERERTEQALRQSEENFRSLAEEANDGILIADGAGVHVFGNRKAERLLGYGPGEIIGTPLARIVHPEELEQLERRRRGRLEGEPAPECYETRLMTRDGREVPIELSATPIHWQGGDATLVIFRDVSERKRLERELRHAQKMEALGTLSGGVAHDFNNLFMSILGSASLMMMDLEPGHPHHERLRVIEEQVDRGQTLTSQLLGYAQQGRYHVRPIRMDLLVEETVRTFEKTHAAHVVRRDLASAAESVRVDSGQVRQVLLNLLFNAADAMPDGGEIQVVTSCVSRESLQGRPYSPGHERYVHLAVTDRGAGMDPRTRERVFEPFFTTREAGRGTGLGLASSYGIVKAHQGYIDVESEPGAGTTFHVYLPVSEEAADALPAPRSLPLRGVGTILFVEDEESVLEIANEMLSSLGYRVLQASGGREALEIYQREGGRVDLVVMDMAMPGMSGGETFLRLKEVDPGARVLLSSGYNIEQEAAVYLEKGCKGFIQKPYSLAELSRTVRKALEQD